MNIFSFLKEIIQRFPLLLFCNTFLLMLLSLVGIVSIFTIAPIIDYLMHPNLEEASAVTRRFAASIEALGVPATFGSFVGVFLIFQTLKSGFVILSRYFILKMKYAVVEDLIVGTFEDFFKARWLFFSGKKQGTLLNTFMREMTIAGDAFGAIGLFFASLLQVIFYMAVPFYISVETTLICLVSAVVLAAPFLKLGKLNYRLGREGTTSGNTMISVIQESLSLAKVVLGFGNQHKSLKTLSQAYDVHRQATLKAQTLQVATPLIYEPIGLAVVAIGLFTAREYGVPFSELAVLLWALRYSIPTLGGLVAERNRLTNFLPSYEQIKSLREQSKALRQRSGGRQFSRFEKNIVVENLGFSYPDQSPALQDVNLKISKGHMVALVGESGAGKSTLIDMIMGFHEPSTGQILLDGVPLEAFEIQSYRQRIGYVPQDSVLFNMTIRDNLLWASEGATDEEMEVACRQANAHEFIQMFPDGYDTLVGDRGVRLSGGQCQRIALARAILRKPELLILDEATSSLDTHSERLIQEAIKNIAKETTVLAIAHRLSTIVDADYVYVLQDGKVVEEGTYQMLVKQDGHFTRMTQLQMLEPAT